MTRLCVEGGESMEYLIKKVGPNKYTLGMRGTGKFEEVTKTDRQITAFFLYLQLTGQVIINDEIVKKPFPVDKEIQNALKILARKLR